MAKADFSRRHIGLGESDLESMLQLLDCTSLDDLMEKVVPEAIVRSEPLKTPEALSEPDFLESMREMAKKNKCYKNFIGQGYYGTHVPSIGA